MQIEMHKLIYKNYIDELKFNRSEIQRTKLVFQKVAKTLEIGFTDWLLIAGSTRPSTIQLTTISFRTGKSKSLD